MVKFSTVCFDVTISVFVNSVVAVTSGALMATPTFAFTPLYPASSL